MFSRIGSPGFARDEDDLRASPAASFDRGINPAGTCASSPRSSRPATARRCCARSRAPTLVIHGTARQARAAVGRPRDRARDPRRAAADDRGHGPRPPARRLAADPRRDRGERRARRRAGRRRGERRRRPRPSPTRPSCRSAPAATSCSRRSATTRSSSSRARPARARRRSCRSCASSSAATRIAHTQPRRLAARTVAERIAEELDVAARRGGRLRRALQRPLARGHARAADDRRPAAGRDPARPAAAPLRHDHRRRGARAQPQHRLPARLPQADPAAAARPEGDHHLGDDRPRALRRHFGDAPVVEVSGRTYPVEVRYRPVEDADRDQADAIGDAVDELLREGPGDVLVFLSGEREIRDTADALRGRLGAPTSRSCRSTRGCRPPSSSASSSRTRGRRVVLATNVAETSLTVPGHPLRRRPGHGADQPLQRAAEGPAAADRADLAGVGRPAQGPLRAHVATASASASTPRRTSRRARASPIRRSCARASRR